MALAERRQRRQQDWTLASRVASSKAWAGNRRAHGVARRAPRRGRRTSGSDPAVGDGRAAVSSIPLTQACTSVITGRMRSWTSWSRFDSVAGLAHAIPGAFKSLRPSSGSRGRRRRARCLPPSLESSVSLEAIARASHAACRPDTTRFRRPHHRQSPRRPARRASRGSPASSSAAPAKVGNRQVGVGGRRLPKCCHRRTKSAPRLSWGPRRPGRSAVGRFAPVPTVGGGAVGGEDGDGRGRRRHARARVSDIRPANPNGQGTGDLPAACGWRCAEQASDSSRRST